MNGRGGGRKGGCEWRGWNEGGGGAVIIIRMLLKRLK